MSLMDGTTRHDSADPAAKAPLERAADELVHPVAGPWVVPSSGRWPTRRRVAAASIVAVLILGVAVRSGWDPAGAPLWSALSLAAIVAAAITLATFVPAAGQGWRPDLGCGSCAAGSGVAALAGGWLAVSSAFDGGTASLALALAGAALAKRLTDPVTCQA